MKKELIMAAVFLGLALVLWFAFLRPVPVRTARGVIRCKTFKAAGEYVQYPAGDRSGFRAPARIPMAEHYVLEIVLDGQPTALTYAVNTTAATAFDVGQQVDVEYQVRGIAPFWRRSYVVDVKRRD